MKHKLFTVLLIGLLVFSSLDMTLAAKVKCPTCKGTGQIDCPKCEGTGYLGETELVECTRCSGSGLAAPNIIQVTMTADKRASTTDVSAVYENREVIEIEATITASLDDHSVTSEKITFPSQEEVPVELSIPYTTYYSGVTLMTQIDMTANGEEITCPKCNGQGTVTQGTVCNKCDGTSQIECPICGGSGYVTEGAAILSANQGGGVDFVLIGEVVGVIVAVLVVGIVGFVFIKKRRVNENSLKRLSSSYFQQWVLKRLDGKPGASKDIAMGIDGFSRLNLPISIKQTDSVGINTIELFAASIAKNRSTGGIIVAFAFSDDAIRGKVRARTNYRLDIQMITIRELIESRTSSY
jgi:hypothetical protein